MTTFRTMMSVGVVLAFCAAAQAQQPNGPVDFREMLTKLDKNGDKILEKAEIPEAGQEAFDRLLKRGDSNKDGKLSADEMKSLSQKMQIAADPGAVATRFKGMDKDKDGKITRAEWTGVEMNFEKIDTDKNGSISEPELLAFTTGRVGAAKSAPTKPAETPKPEAEKPKAIAKKAGGAAAGPIQRFKELDKDGDGKLSKEEFPRPKIFERLDTDNDGFLTPAELAKLKKAE